MNLFDQYLKRSQEIIGDRTKEEEQYDFAVIENLQKYGKIRKALNKANKKYPNEAIKYDETNINDIEAHYLYFMDHLKIMKKISH